MSVTAELHDGRVLEFPDGTDPSVVQRTVKKVLGIQDGEFAKQTGSLVDKIPLEQPERGLPQQPMTKPTQPPLYSSELASMTRPIWEPAAAIASGMAGQVAGTLAGVGKELFTGDFGKGTAEKTAKSIMEKMQYQPPSQGGKDVLETIGTVSNKSKLAGSPMADLSMLGPLSQATQATKQATPVASNMAGIPREILNARRLAKQEAAAIATRNALPQIETVKAGIEGGYTFNPAKTNPTKGNLVKEHVVGDSRINNAAFEKNQAQANADARAVLGQQNGVGLDSKLFDKIKAEATRPYSEVEKIPTIKTDAEFLDNIQGGSWIKDLPPEQQALFKSSPAVNELIKSASLPEYNGIAAMKYLIKLRDDAGKVFRSQASSEDAIAVAQAKWTIARELEKNIERQLESMHRVDPSKGYADLAQRLREGRQKYAEVSAIERATDPIGNVDVLKLAKDKRGDSFTGKLELMKNLGESYPELFKHHGATIPETIRRYGVGGILGGLVGSVGGPGGIAAGMLAGGAADPALAVLLRRSMMKPANQVKNAIPADMRPMREQLGYAQNLGPRTIPINRDIPHSLPELNPQPAKGPLPSVESLVIPESWREGLLQRGGRSNLPAMSEDLLPNNAGGALITPNAGSTRFPQLPPDISMPPLMPLPARPIAGKSAPIGIPDQLLPLSEQYPQGIPIGMAEGRMPVAETPLPQLPPLERGLLSLEDPATVRVSGKRTGLLDIEYPSDLKIKSFKSEVARIRKDKILSEEKQAKLDELLDRLGGINENQRVVAMDEIRKLIGLNKE